MSSEARRKRGRAVYEEGGGKQRWWKGNGGLRKNAYCCVKMNLDRIAIRISRKV
jgi:hypothetical protein